MSSSLSSASVRRAISGSRSRSSSIGYWVAFAVYPVPPADFNYGNAGVPAEWLSEHRLSGFAAHWQKNSNLGSAFELWFRNLFPAAKPFLFNRGGYVTLSFIPTLGTMILGLLAGKHAPQPAHAVGEDRLARRPPARSRWPRAGRSGRPAFARS